MIMKDKSTLDEKKRILLDALKSAMSLESRSEIVCSVLECIRDAYIDIDNNDEKEKFLIDEMTRLIEEIRK
jgi:hypothetical protein